MSEISTDMSKYEIHHFRDLVGRPVHPGIGGIRGMTTIKNPNGPGHSLLLFWTTPSHVLQAMGLDEEAVSGARRFSWCHMTPQPNWEGFVSAVESLTG